MNDPRESHPRRRSYEETLALGAVEYADVIDLVVALGFPTEFT
jgi:hypothetical protein